MSASMYANFGYECVRWIILGLTITNLTMVRATDQPPLLLIPPGSLDWPLLLKSVNSPLAQCQRWLSGGGRCYLEPVLLGFISSAEKAGGEVGRKVSGRRRETRWSMTVPTLGGFLSVGAQIRTFFKFPQTDPQSSQCALKGASHYLQSCTSHSILQAGTANTAQLSFHIIHWGYTCCVAAEIRRCGIQPLRPCPHARRAANKSIV